jgi:hypothetical protein
MIYALDGRKISLDARMLLICCTFSVNMSCYFSGEKQLCSERRNHGEVSSTDAAILAQ